MTVPSHRIEGLIARVTLALVVFFGAASLLAIVFLVHEGRPLERATRLAMPLTVLAAAVPAVVLVRRGRPRLGAGLVLGATHASIIVYVVASGYGAHSYMFAIVAILVLLASLLIGPRAGLVAAAIALATYAALVVAELGGRITDAEAIRAIPLVNIAIVYVVAISALGAIPYFFSRAFQDSLRAADEQERRLKEFLEVAPLGYLIHRDDRIVYANLVATAMAGLTSADTMVGKSIRALMPASEREHFDARLRDARSLEPGMRLPTTLYRHADPAGRERTIETLTVCVALVDGPALVTVLRDVTRDRQAAGALAEAKRQAEAASQAKSDFVANMSHEIRTPLNAIVGLTHLLQDPSLAAESRDDYLARVRTASQALLEIVSDVLDVSKIEAGAIELESVDFDPRREMDAVVQIHAALASDNGVSLDASVAPDVPATLRGDPMRFRQIVNNYVANAVKFTARGGVTARLLAPRPGHVRIEVSDTGIGIDADRRARLFRPFTQADESTTRRYGGTGLGLALCRQLAELMGGSVGVESQPGAGSRFWADLPLPAGGAVASATSAAREGAEGAGRAEALAGSRVLLVEDNEVNRIVATSVLTHLGVDVTAVTDGREAVAHLSAPDAPVYDAVLMDIQMPEMDGYEATRRLRERYPAERLPIIAMTAAAFDDDRRRCFEAGMNDYLAKPFESQQLATTLARWIRGPARPSAG